MCHRSGQCLSHPATKKPLTKKRNRSRSHRVGHSPQGQQVCGAMEGEQPAVSVSPSHPAAKKPLTEKRHRSRSRRASHSPQGQQVRCHGGRAAHPAHDGGEEGPRQGAAPGVSERVAHDVHRRQAACAVGGGNHGSLGDTRVGRSFVRSPAQARCCVVARCQ